VRHVTCARALIACATLAGATTTHAAPPALGELIDRAHRHALAAREQAGAVAEAEAAVAVAAGALWPALTASAGYVRNQHEVTVSIPRGDDPPLDATITPFDQLDVSLQLTVPLLDLASRRQRDAALAQRDAARASLGVTTAEVDRAVVRAYYQWLGGQALARAAAASAQAAASQVELVERRAGAGLALDLDLARARAQEARSRKAIADAKLAIAGAVRLLASLTGVRVEGEAPPLPQDAAAGPALATLAGGIAGLPELVSARASRDAAVARARAERGGLVPAISAFARERVSNAAGFGDAFNWAAGVQLTWQLDGRTLGRIEQGRAAEATSAVRLARADQEARDRLTDAWDQVEALREGVVAATAQAASSELAARIARDQQAQGTATPQQVIDAAAAALDAEVALIRARADLAAARALLQLAAGGQVAP
jgi:outer membrane protein